MKNLFILLVILFSTQYVLAETYTCSSNPIGGSEYNNLNSAYNACANFGDTILLENSPIPYFQSVTNSWSKAITLIGIGGNPDISDQHKTRIGTFGTFNRIGAGNQFYGITFIDDVFILDGEDDISFENCRFIEGLNFIDSDLLLITNNISVVNSVFEKIGEPNINIPAEIIGNMNILNCIFNGSITGNGGLGHVVLIDHCLFLNNATLSSHIVGLRNSTISNNIFLNASVVLLSSVDCTYLNNIVDSGIAIPPAGNFGSGNIAFLPPIFSNYTIGETYSPNHDYNLEASPVGINAATDGTDIGVHGGLTRFDEALEPSLIPIVTSLEIVGGGAEAGEIINVNVKARQPLPE